MTGFLFPGQGSQAVGMGLDYYESSDAARAVFDRAASFLPDDFLEGVFRGDADTLNDTRVAQPALLVVGAAMAAHLASKGTTPAVCAGHSLGEITALVAAGALTLEDAVPLVVERARLMSEDVPEGGMAAVMGLAPEAIEAALPDGAQIANYNSPAQTIISGSQAGLEAAAVALKEAGAKRVLPLKVSGPFHSVFMKPAAEAFAVKLETVMLTAPRVRFVSSVSGQAEEDPEQIRELLARQLYSPVRWIDVMTAIDVPCLEVGPGKVLAGLAKRIDGAPEVTSPER